MAMEMTTFVKVVATLGVPGLVVGIIYVMLRFWRISIAQVPARQAAIVVSLIVLVVGGLTYALIERVWPPPAPPQPPKPVVERQIRFDTKFESVRFYEVGKDQVRADFTIRFVPLTKSNDEVATVFIGMATFHDDEKVDRAAWEKHNRRCEESASCIHAPLVWTWDQPNNEVIVRGGTPGATHKFSANFKRGVKRVLVYWEYYQREGDDGARCEVDGTRRSLLDGLPYLHSVKDGKVVHKWCYTSYDHEVVRVVTKI